MQSTSACCGHNARNHRKMSRSTFWIHCVFLLGWKVQTYQSRLYCQYNAIAGCDSTAEIETQSCPCRLDVVVWGHWRMSIRRECLARRACVSTWCVSTCKLPLAKVDYCESFFQLKVVSLCPCTLCYNFESTSHSYNIWSFPGSKKPRRHCTNLSLAHLMFAMALLIEVDCSIQRSLILNFGGRETCKRNISLMIHEMLHVLFRWCRWNISSKEARLATRSPIMKSSSVVQSKSLSNKLLGNDRLSNWMSDSAPWSDVVHSLVGLGSLVGDSSTTIKMFVIYI